VQGRSDPNRELLEQNLGKPLTRVPDPFGTHISFGEHNNARLRAFLDTFGFDYEFASSTEYYTSGKFDAALLRMLERLDPVMKIMLPSGHAGKMGYASAGALADFIIVNMVAEAASGSKTPKEAAERAQKRAERYYKV